MSDNPRPQQHQKEGQEDVLAFLQDLDSTLSGTTPTSLPPAVRPQPVSASTLPEPTSTVLNHHAISEDISLHSTASTSGDTSTPPQQQRATSPSDDVSTFLQQLGLHEKRSTPNIAAASAFASTSPSPSLAKDPPSHHSPSERERLKRIGALPSTSTASSIGNLTKDTIISKEENTFFSASPGSGESLPAVSPFVSDLNDADQSTKAWSSWLSSVTSKVTSSAKSLANDIGKGQIPDVIASGKLTQSLTKNLNNLVDSIAPITVEFGAPDSHSIFPKLVLWFCMPSLRKENLLTLDAFVKAQVNELWLGNRGICESVKVNSVEHNSSNLASSLTEAIESTEQTLMRLEKLATENCNHLYLLAHPISLTPTTSTKILVPGIHDLYYITLVMDIPNHGLESCSCLSQSVVRGSKGVELQRHLENAIGDLLWEFTTKLRP